MADDDWASVENQRSGGKAGQVFMSGIGWTDLPQSAEDKVIAQVRCVLALRDTDGAIPHNMEATSALQTLAILVQHLDAERQRSFQVSTGTTKR